jgi:hypothetical protein
LFKSIAKSLVLLAATGALVVLPGWKFLMDLEYIPSDEEIRKVFASNKPAFEHLKRDVLDGPKVFTLWSANAETDYAELTPSAKNEMLKEMKALHVLSIWQNSDKNGANTILSMYSCGLLDRGESKGVAFIPNSVRTAPSDDLLDQSGWMIWRSREHEL